MRRKKKSKQYKTGPRQKGILELKFGVHKGKEHGAVHAMPKKAALENAWVKLSTGPFGPSITLQSACQASGPGKAIFSGPLALIPPQA